MISAGDFMKRLILKAITHYQAVSQHKTPTCKYHPTCSHYAKEAFETRNFFVATGLSVWRILRCNPLSKGGYDPVPKSKETKHE